MTYPGTMIHDLQERAERVERDYVTFMARQLRVCRICRQTYADHSHENGFCPTGLDRGPFFNPTRRFTAITCQASVGDSAYQCDRECVSGTEFCTAHTEE